MYLLSVDFQYALVEKNGEKFIDGRDFVQKFLGLFPDEERNTESVKLFAGIADTSKDGYVNGMWTKIYLETRKDFYYRVYSYLYNFRLISFTEFQAFEGHLCEPDALYKTAFQLFDLNGTGLIGFGIHWFSFVC